MDRSESRHTHQPNERGAEQESERGRHESGRGRHESGEGEKHKKRAKHGAASETRLLSRTCSFSFAAAAPLLPRLLPAALVRSRFELEATKMAAALLDDVDTAYQDLDITTEDVNFDEIDGIHPRPRSPAIISVRLARI